MNWTTLGNLVVKFFQIINLIKKTAIEQGVTTEQVFSLLDEKHGREALGTAVRIFIQEVNRLWEWNIEVWESPTPMTWDEAQHWAKTIGYGWRLPTPKDNLAWVQKQLGNYSDYWTDSYFTMHGTGCSFYCSGAGICSTDPSKKIGVCLIRETSGKSWQLVSDKVITPSEPML